MVKGFRRFIGGVVSSGTSVDDDDEWEQRI